MRCTESISAYVREVVMEIEADKKRLWKNYTLEMSGTLV